MNSRRALAPRLAWRIWRITKRPWKNCAFIVCHRAGRAAATSSTRPFVVSSVVPTGSVAPPTSGLNPRGACAKPPGGL